VPPPAEPAHAAAAPAPTEAAAAAAGDIATAPVPPFAGAAMHAGAHGESAEHGGEPAGPVIENWWSWDYGPGKSHHHPPFGFALLNFAIFLLLMNKLFGKSFRDFLQNRHSDVRRAIDRAREVQQQAEQQLQQIEDRARNQEAEIAELLASFRKQAEAERQAIVLRAENEAAGLLRDAESQAQAAIASAKQALEQKAALLAVDLAEKLIRSRIQESDQRRLSDEYLRELEGLASRTAAPPVAAVANKEAP
jgi:F-type H+-transporting ATPase subunit b